MIILILFIGQTRQYMRKLVGNFGHNFGNNSFLIYKPSQTHQVWLLCWEGCCESINLLDISEYFQENEICVFYVIHTLDIFLSPSSPI